MNRKDNRIQAGKDRMTKPRRSSPAGHLSGGGNHERTVMISDSVGMERIAPFLVVTRYAAAFAKRSISVKDASVRSSRPLFSTSCRTQAQKVSPAPVVSIVPPSRNALPFAKRFKAAGGDITVVAREMYAHHPHGVEVDESTIKDFFLSEGAPSAK